MAEPYVNLSMLSPEVFAARLSMVMNMWYQLTLAGNSSVFLGLDDVSLVAAAANSAVFGYDFARLLSTQGTSGANGGENSHNGTSDLPLPEVVRESCQLFCSGRAEATVTHTVEVFRANRDWLAQHFISSAVLLATGLMGTFVGWRSLAPDILGYAASMTYNNSYMTMPDHENGEGEDEGVANDGSSCRSGSASASRGHEGADEGDEKDERGVSVNGSGSEEGDENVEEEGFGDDHIAGALDATYRTRVCGNLSVVIGDVRGDDPEVGHWTFTFAGRPNLRALKKGRSYV